MSVWTQLQDQVYLLRDSCLVYAVQGSEGTVLVNAGTGLAAEHLGEVVVGDEIVVLLTHHFRDHTDGAIRLQEQGAKVLGPYWDQAYLVDPEQHFRERQIWNSYDNRWDRFSPVRPVPVDGWMMDYEVRRIAGLDWEVIPTPGVTNGAVSYAVTVNGQRLVFVGEVVCGIGKVGRVAPWQYNYNDLTGSVNVWRSSSRILKAGPDWLLPSLGETVDDPQGAVDALKVNLHKLEGIQPGISNQYRDPDEDDIEEVLPHLYRSKYANAQTHFVIGESGKVMAIDYGYHTQAYASPGKHHVSNRRPFLHGLTGLKKRFGVDRIDTILVSHFHDDHVNGMPMLQRLFDSEVWAGENFADILEDPPQYDRPCLWHEPIRVHRRLPLGETFYWENIPITLYPMSGHTRFATLICMEVDETRVSHTGDQIFFRGGKDGNAYGEGSRNFTNHVYKNGLDVGCYMQTLGDLKAFRPELVLTGHTQPYRPDDAWLDVIEGGAQAFDEAHTSLMALGDDDVHFGAESQGAKLKPYQVHAPDGGRIDFNGWVLNPFPFAQTATLKLICPDGWQSEPIFVEMDAREQKAIRVSVIPPPEAICRRQPVALDLTVGDRPFGQVTEALVTVGLPVF